MSRSPPAEPKVQHRRNYDSHMTHRVVTGSLQGFLEMTRRSSTTFFRSPGDDMRGFRFRFRRFAVTKTAQAVKLSNPTNKINLIICTPVREFEQLGVRVWEIKSEPGTMHAILSR
jgi:hypothetical protein